MRILQCYLFLTVFGSFLVADDKLVTAVESVFEAGFRGQRTALPELEGAFNAAVAKSIDHPALRLAYASVLVKNFHGEEGLQQLELAAQSDQPVLFLAREEWIRELLDQGDYPAALKALHELAEAIQQVPENQNQDEAQRSARWVGVIMAYLEGPLGLDSVREQALTVEPGIRQCLGGLYEISYRKGRYRVSLRQRDLEQQIAETKASIESESKETTKQLQAEAVEILNKKEAINEEVQEFRDVAGEAIDDLDGKVEALEKQFEASLEAEVSMQISAAQIQHQIQQLKRKLELKQNGRVVTRNRGNFDTEQRIGLLERELVLLTSNYALLLESRRGLTNTAQRLINERQRAAADAQARVNSASETIQRLNRLQNRLAAKHKQANESADEDIKINRLTAQIKKLSTYEQRSFEDLRDLLVEVVSAP